MQGKSTLLRLISGEMYLDEGEIFVINESGSELIRTNVGRTKRGKESDRKLRIARGETAMSRIGSKVGEGSTIMRTPNRGAEEEEEFRQRPYVSDAVQIGFCPQYDPLYDYMTVAQHLRLYALMRGMRANQIDTFVTGALQQLNLEDLAAVNVHQLR